MGQSAFRYQRKQWQEKSQTKMLKLLVTLLFAKLVLGSIIHESELVLGNTIHESGNVIHGSGNVIHGTGHTIYGTGNSIHGTGNIVYGTGNIIHGPGNTVVIGIKAPTVPGPAANADVVNSIKNQTATDTSEQKPTSAPTKKIIWPSFNTALNYVTDVKNPTSLSPTRNIEDNESSTAEENTGDIILTQCECVTPTESCDKCEVDCGSDCNDLTKEGGSFWGKRCFSVFACDRDLLLFDVDYSV